MSADNMICVQKRLDGRWWVWMGFASDDVNEPNEKYDKHFQTHEEAEVYALGWARGEMWLEYGIWEMDPQESEPESKAYQVYAEGMEHSARVMSKRDRRQALPAITGKIDCPGCPSGKIYYVIGRVENER